MKNKQLKAFDLGPEAATLLTHFMGYKCSLVRVHGSHRGQDDGIVSLGADSSIIAFENLLTKEGIPLPQAASHIFRDNIRVSGAKPYAEKRWEQLGIGDSIMLTNGQDAPRKQTIGRLTKEGTYDPRVLKMLVKSNESKGNEKQAGFGRYYNTEVQPGSSNTIRVGDPVTVVKYVTVFDARVKKPIENSREKNV